MLRPDEVVLSGGDAARPDGGLVGEGMVCQIAMEVEGHAGFAQFVLRRIDGDDREEVVLRGPMRLQRRLDLGRVDVWFQMKRDGDSWKPGRNAVPPIWRSVGYAGVASMNSVPQIETADAASSG